MGRAGMFPALNWRPSYKGTATGGRNAFSLFRAGWTLSYEKTRIAVESHHVQTLALCSIQCQLPYTRFRCLCPLLFAVEVLLSTILPLTGHMCVLLRAFRLMRNLRQTQGSFSWSIILRNNSLGLGYVRIMNLLSAGTYSKIPMPPSSMR